MSVSHMAAPVGSRIGARSLSSARSTVGASGTHLRSGSPLAAARQSLGLRAAVEVSKAASTSLRSPPGLSSCHVGSRGLHVSSSGRSSAAANWTRSQLEPVRVPTARARAASLTVGKASRPSESFSDLLQQVGLATEAQTTQQGNSNTANDPNTGDFLDMIAQGDSESDSLQRALAMSLRESTELEIAARWEVEAAEAELQSQGDGSARRAIQVADAADIEAAARMSPTDRDQDTQMPSESPHPTDSPTSIDILQNFIDASMPPAVARAASLSSAKPPQDVVRSFAPRRWLSDASISYVYERLMLPTAEVPEGSASPEGIGELPEDILLIDAATTFWLTMQSNQSVVREMLGPLNLEEKKLVLCPLNNSRDRGRADGGTHWGLLVWDRRGVVGTAHQDSELPQDHESLVGRFIYYDSGFFRGSCQVLADKLACKLAGRRLRTTLGQSARQDNFYDCGMYVILFSEIIVNSFLKEGAASTARVPVWEKTLRALKPASVTQRRAEFFQQLRMAAVSDDTPSVAKGGG